MAGAVQTADSATTVATTVDMVTWGDWTILHASGSWYHDSVAILYKPGVSYATLPNAPTNAACFLKRANQLFAIGHGTNRRLVSCSDADDIEDWTPTPTNLAVELPLEDMNSPIIGGAILGSNVAVYGDDQMALIYWIGPPDYFGRRMALDGIGIVSKTAVCADGPLNYGVSRNGPWRTDGNSYEYIGQSVLHDYLEANVNWSQKSKIHCFRNDVTHCIEFHFPMGSSSSASEAWSFDPATGGWGPVTAFDIAQERKLFDYVLGARDGIVYTTGSDATATAALDLSTKPLLMQTPQGAPLHEGSLIDEIEIFTKSASNVEFRYGVCEDIDGSYDWTGWITLVVDLTTYQGFRAKTGVFHKLEFRSIAANWSLDLQGFVLYGSNTQGTKRSAT